jgi:hypothetical protein
MGTAVPSRRGRWWPGPEHECRARCGRAVNGLPEYAFAIIAHPIADNDGETLRVKAERVAEQLAQTSRRAYWLRHQGYGVPT